MNAIAPLVATIACTVIANLLMKLGSRDEASQLLLGMMSWRTLSGLAVFGLGGLFYARVLRFLPLNVAQSIGAAQFIAVILGSRLVLDEAIPLTRWVGISLIATGIVVVAWYET